MFKYLEAWKAGRLEGWKAGRLEGFKIVAHPVPLNLNILKALKQPPRVHLVTRRRPRVTF